MAEKKEAERKEYEEKYDSLLRENPAFNMPT